MHCMDLTIPKVTKPETEMLYLQDRDVRFFQTLKTDETVTFNLQDQDETERFQKTSRDCLETETFKTETTSLLPLIFTKLATKVESQEMSLPIVLVEMRNISIHQTGSGINPHHCSYGKIF